MSHEQAYLSLEDQYGVVSTYLLDAMKSRNNFSSLLLYHVILFYHWLLNHSILVLSHMERTRTTSAVGHELEPPVTTTTRGRGQGRVQPRARVAAAVVEPQIDHEKEVPTKIVPVGPTQVPEVFIATSVLHDTLVHLVGLMESVAESGAFAVAQNVSQAGEGAQTHATHTPKQAIPLYQTPATHPIGLVQSIMVVKAGYRPLMSSKALLRLDMFTKSSLFILVVHFLRIHNITWTVATRYCATWV